MKWAQKKYQIIIIKLLLLSLRVLMQLSNRNFAITLSMHGQWERTKDVQRQGPSNLSLNLFVSFFDVYQPS